VTEESIEMEGMEFAVRGADLKGLLGRTLMRAEKPYERLRFHLVGRFSAPLPALRVAVVGTSEPSGEGLEFATRLVKNLVRERVTVVSGLIRGIGAAALRAALARGGTAVAVLGSPIEAPRPPEIRELQLRLMREHVVVSQFPSGSPLTLKEDSPVIMERAVALLSDVLVVAEAGEPESVHAVREAVRLGGRSSSQVWWRSRYFLAKRGQGNLRR